MKVKLLLIAGLGLAIALLASRTAWAAGLELDAPGGLRYEKDGTITALGTSSRPLTVILGAYEVAARSLRYNQRKQTGQAQGDVRWRERKAPGVREFTADSVSFAMLIRAAHAEGHVEVKEQGMILRADEAQIDLAAGSYQVSGQPARAEYEGGSVSAGRINYDAARSVIEAELEVVWRAGARTVTSASLAYNLAARTGTAVGGIEAAEGDYRLTAKELAYTGDTGGFTLTGQPVLTGKDLSLSAERLTWQPAEGLAIAAGGARFSGAGFTGNSEEIRFTAAENRVHLLGGASIVHGRDTLSGAEIVCDLANGGANVTGPAKATIYIEEE
ncbi:MAG: LptA/OstA family protein [Patescibacteria group bacterium]